MRWTWCKIRTDDEALTKANSECDVFLMDPAENKQAEDYISALLLVLKTIVIRIREANGDLLPAEVSPRKGCPQIL
jgi:hypothetical protein